MNVPARPDQVPGTPSPGSIAPGQSGLIVARTIVIFGTGIGGVGGIFVYNGTPAAGNTPILSIAGLGVSTDPYGNPVIPTLTVGNEAGAYVNIDDNGNILLTDATAAGRILLSPNNVLQAFYDANYDLDYPLLAVAGQNTIDFAGHDISGGVTLADLPLLVYGSATPASGNLTTSVAPAASSDTFGNDYPAGLMVQTPGGPQIEINAGRIIINNNTSRGAGVTSALIDATATTVPQIEIVSGIGTALGAYAGKLLTAGGDTGSDAIFGILNLLAAFSPSSGYPTLESWQNVANANGWSGGRYAMMPYGVTSNMVWLNGTLTAGTTVADGTNIGTVGAAYQPASAQSMPVATNNALATAGDQSPHLVVQTSGQIHCFGIRATGDIITVNAGYPLD